MTLPQSLVDFLDHLGICLPDPSNWKKPSYPCEEPPF